MLPFSLSYRTDRKFSDCKLCLDRGVSGKEFIKSSRKKQPQVQEGGALGPSLGDWLANWKASTSNLWTAPCRPGLEWSLPFPCLLLRQGVLASLLTPLHLSPLGLLIHAGVGALLSWKLGEGVWCPWNSYDLPSSSSMDLHLPLSPGCQGECVRFAQRAVQSALWKQHEDQKTGPMAPV